jgi:hypothetical protein
MGFNKRKMEDRRRQAAEKEAAARRATEKQILEDADYLITVWNDRQAMRMPMLFSPTIGAAIKTGYWFLWVRCPACRTTGDVDLRALDWHRGAVEPDFLLACIVVAANYCLFEDWPQVLEVEKAKRTAA